MINGLASGGGVVLVYLAGTEMVHQTSDVIWFQLVVLCFLAISIFSYMVTMWNGGAAAYSSATYLVTREAMLFWGMAIGIGLIVPIVIVAVVASLGMTPMSALGVAMAARLTGDVALRYAFLKAGIYDAVL